MDATKLVEILEEIAEAPKAMWEKRWGDTAEGFFRPDIKSYTPSKKIRKLIELAQEITDRARELVGHVESRMNPVTISTNRCIVYISGGIFLGDEKIQQKLDQYFDVDLCNFSAFLGDKKLGERLKKYFFGADVGGFSIPNPPQHAGLAILMKIKNDYKGVQFAARGAEWERIPGYAHMCLGYIPHGYKDKK